MEKELRLSRGNRKVVGVCGGLGDYFGIDPVLFRAAFLFMTFVGGAGIIAYLVFWAVMPEE